MKNWRIVEVKDGKDKETNGNIEDFFGYLKDFIRDNDYIKVFEELKYSDILLKSETEKLQVQDFLNRELLKIDDKNFIENKKRTEKFFDEIKLLNDLYYEMVKLKKERISGDEFIVSNMCNYINNLLENEKNLDVFEECVIVLSTFLKDMMINRELTFKYSEEVSKKEEEIEKVFKIYQDLYRFGYLTDIWKFGDLKILDDYFEEEGEIGKNKIISQILYFEKKETKVHAVNLIESFLISQIKEYFHSSNLEDVYKKIPLKNWLKVYLILYYLVIENKNSIKIQRYKEDELLDLLSKYEKRYDCILKENIEKIEDEDTKLLVSTLRSVNLSKDDIEEILEHFIFSKNSKDLYDSPIIEFKENGSIYNIILPQIFLRTDHSRALISILSSDNKSEIDQKGTNLEKYIYSLMNNSKIHYKPNVRKTLNNESYELDMMFCIDKELIIVEIKTHNQPEKYYDFYRSMEKFEEDIEKFNRNVKYFINNQKEYIEENVGEYNRYKKIFLSDITYNMSDFEDIIIIDKEDFEKTLSNLKNKNNYIEKLLDFRKEKIDELNLQVSKDLIRFTRKYKGFIGYKAYSIKNN